MFPFEPVLIFGLVFLCLLSLNLVALTAARLLAPPRRLARARLDEDDLPPVLIQLPLYNEGDLVRRSLAAVTALDWPPDRLEIQVLDDSTDGSEAISRAAVAELAAAGWRIELLHRTRRTAFKAGALAAGLERTGARYVAIFDADFVPRPDFLRRTVPVLAAGPHLAFVQTRWAHMNASDNLLTRAQARLLDGHFGVEQEGRFRVGLPVPFNGTCGVWRRSAILDAGGWAGDTLTEDLDLSLRARLRGWSSAYLDDVTVPGVLPTAARAWRVQQFRWTKGFVQCAVKLTPAIWQSRTLPLWHKAAMTLQLGQPLAFLTGALCTLLGLPYVAGIAVAGDTLTAMAVLTSLLGILGAVGFLAAATTPQTAPRAAREIVGSVFLTTGLLLSNARAGLESLLGHTSEFVRTPKSAGQAGAAAPKGRGLRCGLAELGVGLGLLGFVLMEQPVSVIYLALVIGGLVTVGVLQLLDGRAVLKPAAAAAQVR